MLTFAKLTTLNYWLETLYFGQPEPPQAQHHLMKSPGHFDRIGRHIIVLMTVNSNRCL